jgi:hypothetical protein
VRKERREKMLNDIILWKFSAYELMNTWLPAFLFGVVFGFYLFFKNKKDNQKETKKQEDKKIEDKNKELFEENKNKKKYLEKNKEEFLYQYFIHPWINTEISFQKKGYLIYHEDALFVEAKPFPAININSYSNNKDLQDFYTTFYSIIKNFSIRCHYISIYYNNTNMKLFSNLEACLRNLVKYHNNVVQNASARRNFPNIQEELRVLYRKHYDIFYNCFESLIKNFIYNDY